MKTCEVQQMEELVDGSTQKQDSVDLLGCLKHTIKLTGLDCSAAAAAENGHGSKILAFLTKILGISVIIVMLVRAFSYLGEEGLTFSFNWSESNTFGFLGVLAFLCSICLFGWTKNAFVPNHLKRLSAVRVLRIEQDSAIDEYSGLRKKMFFWSLPWMVTLMSFSLYNALNEKLLYSGAPVSVYKYSIFPALSFLAWLITSTCLAIYNLVQFSMIREIEHFNKELQKASEEKKLKNLQTISEFSLRQKELIKLVQKANESLSSYAKVAPLFCFFALINGILNFAFFSEVAVPYKFVLIFLVASSIALSILSMMPAAKVQDQLAVAGKILMESDEIESSVEQQVYQTYRVMIDRTQKMDSRIYVVNAFGIDSVNLNIAMFIVPNSGPILLMIRKLMAINGVKFAEEA